MTSKGKANLELFKTLFSSLCTDEMSVKELYSGGIIVDPYPSKLGIRKKYHFIVRKNGDWELIYE